MSILSLVFLLSQIAQAPGNYNSLMDDLASGNEKRALSTADPFGALSGLANYRRKVNPKVVMKLASALSRGGADPNRREEPTKYKNYVSTQPGPTQLRNSLWLAPTPNRSIRYQGTTFTGLQRRS
jgi:hypothetical protein